MSRKVVAEREMGTRLIAGTEWPVCDQVVRDERPGQRPTWVVVRGLCNGVPRSSEQHRTLREASESFGAVAP